MNDAQYQLLVKRGPEPGKVYPLSSVSVTIGRDPMAEISITDPEVSRQHVRLTGTLSGYKIQDLGSTNGTYVDGVRLGGESVELSVGQIITMGEGVALQFQAASVVQDEMATMLDGRFAPGGYQVGEEVAASDEPAAENIAAIDSHDLIEDPVTQSEQVYDAQYDNRDEEAISDSFSGASEPVVIPHQGEKVRDEQPTDGQGKRRTPVYIVSVLLLILCFCCSFILFMYYYGGDWVLRQMGLMP